MMNTTPKQVLPPESSDFLPKPFKELMTKPESDVLDFYPKEFQIDFNGKKNAWEAVVLIPFIYEKRLQSAVRQIDPSRISPEEMKRNRLGELASLVHCGLCATTSL